MDLILSSLNTHIESVARLSLPQNSRVQHLASAKSPLDGSFDQELERMGMLEYG